jgi:hypothetical protein
MVGFGLVLLVGRSGEWIDSNNVECCMNIQQSNPESSRITIEIESGRPSFALLYVE